MGLFYNFLVLCLLVFFVSPSIAKTSFRPKALLLPVYKDTATLQYVTHIRQRTPLVPVKLTVDIGGNLLWVDCEKDFVSSTFKRARCGSAQCSLARARACGGNMCGIGIDNPATKWGTDGDLGQDVLSIQSTNGFNPGRVVSVPNFVFTCAPNFIVRGLASGVTGVAGLARSKVALPSQLAAAFSFARKFAICLSSSSKYDGVIILGDGPYVLLPGIDVSKSLTYTPLLINPVATTSGFFLGDASVEYFIGVTSIKVSGKAVPFNTSLLSFDDEGFGGTKISTGDPYTVMETSIYNAVVSAFIKEMKNFTRVTPVSPFGACFSSKGIYATRLGPAVPQIDLVLQSKNVYWSIFGANSMVQVSNEVLCLGFVDGGVRPRTSIVIGGYQLEDNLLQIDIASSRLGFSSTLLGWQTTCANFNFASV